MSEKEDSKVGALLNLVITDEVHNSSEFRRGLEQEGIDFGRVWDKVRKEIFNNLENKK